MTAEQYLLSEAEFCRRVASQSPDPYLAGELSRLARQFEANAQRHAHGVLAVVGSPSDTFARSYAIGS